MRQTEALSCGIGHGGARMLFLSHPHNWDSTLASTDVSDCLQQITTLKDSKGSSYLSDSRHLQKLLNNLKPEDKLSTLIVSDTDMAIIHRVRAQFRGLGKPPPWLLTRIVEIDETTSLKFSAQDITRAEGVVRQIMALDNRAFSQPEPYAPSGACRYPNLNFRQSFITNANVEFSETAVFFRIWTNEDVYLGSYARLYRFMLDAFHSFAWSRPANAVLILLLPAVYGCIHLAASRYNFPTDTEKSLWVASCYVVVGAVPGVWIISAAVISCFSAAGDNGDTGSGSIVVLLWYNYFLMVTVSVLYVCSRVFIVLESFLSVRHLPVGVYWMPSWLQMVPHL